MNIWTSDAQRILVAGGAGFIGSNLLRRLLSLGLQVDCIDNLITGQRQNILPFESNPLFEYHQGDIADAVFMAQFDGIRYSRVYNLACPTGVPNIKRLGEEMLLTCSAGSLHMLRIAHACGARYLYASSAEVYGNPEVTPQLETYSGNVDPVGERSAYEEGKRYGEAITMLFARSYGLDARIVRIFNTYGINMSLSETRVIPQMLRNMLQNSTVTIYGDGSNTRAFQYVDDLLDGFELCMGHHCNGDVFNIGGEIETPVKELFAACCEVTGYGGAPAFEGHFIEDHKRRLPDTTRIRKLGWKPVTPLRIGLAACRDDIAGRLALQQPALLREKLPANIRKSVSRYKKNHA